MHVPDREQTLVLELAARPNVRLAVGALRAGALPFLDVDDVATAATTARQVVARATGSFGVRPTPAVEADAVEVARHLPAEVELVLLDAAPARAPHEASPTLASRIEAWAPRRVLVTVTSGAEAAPRSPRARRPDREGLRGRRPHRRPRRSCCSSSCGTSTCRSGRRAASACTPRPRASPAAPRASCSTAQLALVRESRCRRRREAAIAAMDGSETDVIAGHRVFTRPDLPVAHPRPGEPAPAESPRELGATTSTHDLLPVGQDGAFAAPARRALQTRPGGWSQAVRAAIGAHLADARRARQPLAPGRRRRRGPRHALPDRAGPDDARQRPRRASPRRSPTAAACRSSRWR